MMVPNRQHEMRTMNVKRVMSVCGVQSSSGFQARRSGKPRYSIALEQRLGAVGKLVFRHGCGMPAQNGMIFKKPSCGFIGEYQNTKLLQLSLI